jgi:putative membrane protein
MAKPIQIAVLACASAAAFAGCDRGRSVDTSTQKPHEEACATEPNAKLASVFRYLHEMNEAEIRSGNVAADRTQIPDVRQFATSMVTEHASADQKLLDLARRERIGIESVPPVDPIHAAALRYVSIEEQGLQELSPASLDVVYVASSSEQHGFLLEVIEQGQRVAAGDTKSLLDEARDMTVRHRDHAIMLMQDLRFAPRAIGGGPTRDIDLDNDTGASGQVDKNQRGTTRPRRGTEPSSPGAGNSSSQPPAFEDTTRGDSGVWPPVTAPPERTPDHP